MFIHPFIHLFIERANDEKYTPYRYSIKYILEAPYCLHM